MNEIIDALPGLGAVGLATGLVAAHRLIFGDPDANQHDLSDYHPEPEDVQVAEEMLPAGVEVLPPYDAGGWAEIDRQADDILPPAPPGTNAGGSPIHAALVAEQVIAEQLREQYGTTNPDAIAGTMLRQIAAEQVTR